MKERMEDPESLEILKRFDKVVKDMQRMVEQVIRLANLNSQYSISDLQERKVADIIDEAITINQGPIHERNISVKILIPPDMTFCISKIFGVSIFSNIINNAAKYNAPSGMIEISAREEQSMILINISDTGVGIKPEDLDQIWDELYICDIARSDPTSKGLGLSIVRKLVELHGGEIRVDSPGIGKGTTFTVLIPKSGLKESCKPGVSREHDEDDT